MFGHKHKLGEYSKNIPSVNAILSGKMFCAGTTEKTNSKRKKNIFSIFLFCLSSGCSHCWIQNERGNSCVVTEGRRRLTQVISNSVFRSNSIHQVITKWSDVYFVNSIFLHFRLILRLHAVDHPLFFLFTFRFSFLSLSFHC